ncbi:MAG TPA: lipopolysaccharide heptosyltransferase II [Gemmatimonadaceae bacterium]|nr:lipopolysaccharide heptosyltransferase II [Gemmatimonadaceae bacterium]
MSSSLVVQTSFLGDSVLTTPLLAQLANRGPVDVVTTPAAASLLANHPAVRTVIPYDKRGDDRGLIGLWRLARRLRETGYDVAFLAQGSWRSAALALLAGVPARVGFATSAGRWLYTKRVAYRDHLHHAARLLMLARPNGREPTPEELRPSLAPGAAERAEVDAFLRERGVGPGDRLVAVAPGSVWGTKRWPFYPQLAQALAATARVVVVGSGADSPLAAEILAGAPGALDATGALSLLASAELIGRCGVLVTNDSAPMHLASAMGTPTVAIFGPTVPAFGFGPLAPRSEVVGHEALPCRPCDRHGPQRCPLGHHRCMRELPPSVVAERARALLLNPDVLA